MNLLVLLAVAATTVVVSAKAVDEMTIYTTKEAAEACKVEKCALLTQKALSSVFAAGVEAGKKEFRDRLDTDMCLKGAL